MTTIHPVVLIVDDDAATRDLVADLMALEGYAAQAAATGQSALTHLRGVGSYLLAEGRSS